MEYVIYGLASLIVILILLTKKPLKKISVSIFNFFKIDAEFYE
jgi:hypothetical protein